MTKILLATPHMPPTPGGPSTHAKKLVEHFNFQLFNFEKYKKFPSGIRHCLAFVEIFFKSFGKDKILVLDGFTVALPSIFVGKILFKEIDLRVGGDFIYEQFLYTKEVDFETLYNNFNEYKKYFSKKLYIKYLIQKFILQNADKIIFNTEWQKNIFVKHYELKKENVFVIENPVSPIPKEIYENKKFENNSKYFFTSITRDIPYKNQKRLQEAFESLDKNNFYLETKQDTWENCLKKISMSRAYICASVSDIAPNQVLEAISFGVPVIITKYSGLTNILEKAGVAKVIDPFSVSEIRNAVLEMCDDKKYKIYKDNLEKFSWPQNWESLYKQYEKILYTKKLVYILPEASEKTHMKYNVEFLKNLSEQSVEIFLILERGASTNKKEYLQKIKEKTGAKYVRYSGENFFTRIFKLEIFLLESFLKGYRKVYVHYSFVGAICISLFPFAKVFYWNCGLPWQYKRPFLQEFYESLAYKLVDYFVTGSKSLAEKYSEYYKFDIKKNITIPNWIDLEKINKNFNKLKIKEELRIPENKKVLFFNQRLSERKGANYLPTILENFKDCILLISNEGPYEKKLIENLQEKNIFENVRMLGKISNEKVMEIFSIVDLYLSPSNEEGMSHSLLEAFASGVPAVSFDVGATKEMYPENYKKYVVEVGNLKEFNEQISMLLQSETERKEFTQAILEEIKKYNKKIVLEEFINKIL